jgi:fructose transport system ATP-binding protein
VDQEGTRMTTTTATSTPVLQARGLVKTFGHVVGHAGVDLDINACEVVSHIRHNGAGKSTQIK